MSEEVRVDEEGMATVFVGRKIVEDSIENILGWGRVPSLAAEIANEVNRARTMFPEIYSLHEALGIVQEEFDEFKEEVYAHNLVKHRDRRPAARVELIQLAAMCMRTILDVIDRSSSLGETK